MEKNTETNPEWSLLGTVASEVEAHVLRGLLKAHGMPVHLEAESASQLFGITNGALGGVRIYVPKGMLKEAEALLAADVSDEEAEGDSQEAPPT